MSIDKMTDEDVLQHLLDADSVPEKTYELKRLGIPVTLKGLKSKTVYDLRKRCIIKNNKGEQVDFDMEKFNCLLIAAATVKPKWDHPRLLEKYEASGPEEVVKRILLAGELSSLGDIVLSLSGFDEKLEEIKN